MFSFCAKSLIKRQTDLWNITPLLAPLLLNGECRFSCLLAHHFSYITPWVTQTAVHILWRIYGVADNANINSLNLRFFSCRITVAQCRFYEWNIAENLYALWNIILGSLLVIYKVYEHVGANLVRFECYGRTVARTSSYRQVAVK